jgi:hypothetical protein
MRKHTCVLVLMTIIFTSRMSHSAERHRSVSIDEAKNLVSAALPLTTRQLPKFAVEGDSDPNFPTFYSLSATWAGAPNGSMVIGFYYVDKSTGDVWNAVAECQEESNPALRRLQVRIRHQIDLSDAEYRKIKKKGPLCPKE